MPSSSTNPLIDRIKSTYSQIYLIVSPPRCSSTALARVFWEHPRIRYYSHEPFEVTYYENQAVDVALKKILKPIDLHKVKLTPTTPAVSGLIIKEMPYQAGDNFPLLASLTTAPIIFLIRHPLLSIYSRVRRKVEVGDPPRFPFIESGWQLLREQVKWCRETGRRYRLIDATDFRNNQIVLRTLFAALELPFSPAQLRWRPSPELRLDNLDGAHRHLYRSVLKSTTLRRATESKPSLDSFSPVAGFRDHVADCIDIYNRLRRDPRRIAPPPMSNAGSMSRHTGADKGAD